MRKSFLKTMLLISIILMDLLTGMEFDLFVPSFPALQKEFNLSPFSVEALLAINFIGYCLSLFFVGGLADRYGRKPIIFLGLMTFIFGSVLCLYAHLYQFLIVGRFLQGVGIAAPAILSFLIIADTYPLKQQQLLFTILNGLFNAAAGVAPVLGSYITLYFHWQGNFVTLLFLGGISLVMVIFFVPNYKLPKTKESLSIKSYIPLFQSRPLLLLMIHFIFNFIPYWVFVGITPLLYIGDLGVSLAHFGYYQGALAFIFALGSLLFGFVIIRSENKKMLLFSAQIFIFSLVSVGIVTFLGTSNALLITIAFIPFIIGQIITSAILHPVCLNLMPEAKGRVSAVLQGGRLIFSALCLQLAGHFYTGSFRNIGIIIMAFIFMTIVTLFYVIKNRELIVFSKKMVLQSA